MNINAYFKGITLADGEDNLYKLVFHIRKERLLADADALLSMNVLQGGAVQLAVTPTVDDDYLSPAQKRARDEKCKYDEVMAEKRRRESAQLALDEQDDDTPPLDPDGLPRVTNWPDYLDHDGRRWFVGCKGDDAVVCIRDKDGADGECTISCLLPQPDEDRAHTVLKDYAAAHRFTPVAPNGFGAVYGTREDDGGQYCVVANEENNEGFGPGYRIALIMPGKTPEFVSDNLYDPTELAAFAAAKELPFLCYRELPKPPEYDPDLDPMADDTPAEAIDMPEAEDVENVTASGAVFRDSVPLDNCVNEDSMGEVCVRCNQCGRFENAPVIDDEADPPTPPVDPGEALMQRIRDAREAGHMICVRHKNGGNAHTATPMGESAMLTELGGSGARFGIDARTLGNWEEIDYDPFADEGVPPADAPPNEAHVATEEASGDSGDPEVVQDSEAAQKSQAEAEDVQAVSYVDPDGRHSYRVSQGISRKPDAPWFTVRRMVGATSEHRQKSVKLPDRPTQSEAQRDLDAYAQKHGLYAEPGVGDSATAQDASDDLSTPPRLSEIIKCGDCIIRREEKRMPRVPAVPKAVIEVQPVEQKVRMAIGFVSFRALDEDYRLATAAEIESYPPARREAAAALA